MFLHIKELVDGHQNLFAIAVFDSGPGLVNVSDGPM